jgi:hypothetical protein
VLSPYIRKISIEIPVSDSLLEYFLFWCVLQEFQSYFNFSLIDPAGTQLLGPFYSPSAHAKATNTNSSSSPSCSPISNPLSLTCNLYCVTFLEHMKQHSIRKLQQFLYRFISPLPTLFYCTCKLNPCHRPHSSPLSLIFFPCLISTRNGNH